MTTSKKVLICPACGKQMEKIFIKQANCNIDICSNGCGGIFFDNIEFKKIDKNFKSIDEIKKVFDGKEFEKVDETFKHVCPACGMKMVKNSTSIKGQIIIDECYSCGGKFLDYTELDKMRNEYPDEEARAKAVVEYLKSSMGAEYDAMHAHKITKEKSKQKGFLEKIINKLF